jgi:ABC-type lipoprotein export system ATPase subunit
VLLDVIKVGKKVRQSEQTEPITILSDCSLRVAAGEAVAIVGPSGSGKTTLLNLIGTMDTPTSGSILFQDQAIDQLSETERARLRNRHIGFIFQFHYLLPQLSVLENILLPTLPLGTDPEQALQRAQTLARRVGLADRLHHRPGQLSGGECQRVAVIRALINKPQLILADEPTGSLDQHIAMDVGRLLIEINQEEKTALIAVTHSTMLAQLLALRCELRNGRLFPATGL